MSKKPKIITRTSFYRRFKKGFDCHCRACGTEAKILFVSREGQMWLDTIIACPKCKDNYLKL